MATSLELMEFRSRRASRSAPSLQRWRIWDSLVDGFLVLLKSKEVRKLQCRLKKSFIQDFQRAREKKQNNCFSKI